MTRLLHSHPALWALLALPGAWMISRWASGATTYGEVVSATGEIATQLLILTMAITPLRLLFRRGGWLVWLVRRRRDLGVASGAYAGLHAGVYLMRKADLRTIVGEAAEPWLLAGWAALLVLLALALSSNDASVRLMRRGWKRLHRVVYAGATLTFAHWILSAFDPTEAYVYAGVLVALETTRVVLQRRQGAARA